MSKIRYTTGRVGLRLIFVGLIAVAVVSTLLFSWIFRAGVESQPAQAVAERSHLVYTQRIPQGGAEIASVAKDGADRQVVKAVTQPEREGFRLDRLDEILPSPDGQWLAFNRHECTTHNVETVECGASAWVMKRDGADARKIEADHDYYEVVQWFPDSRQLLIRDRPLSLALIFDLGTGEVRRLDIPEIGYSVGRGSLAPDGSKLVYSAYTGEWVYNLNGSGRVKLNVPRSGANLYHMSWSPQGDRIAIAVDVGGEALGNSLSAGELWVVQADGTNPRRLSAPDALVFAPRWDPTGTTIYFVQTEPGTLGVWQNWPDLATGNLWAVQVETGDLRPLTPFEGKGVQSPGLSPDGTTLAFISDAAGADEIWTVGVDGHDLRQVTSDEGSPKISVAWLPAPKQ